MRTSPKALCIWAFSPSILRHAKAEVLQPKEALPQLFTGADAPDETFTLVGQQLINMGHSASSAGGGIAGGYQGIMFVPTAPDPNLHDDEDHGHRLNGFYRAGSNFREDGDSIGW